MPTINQLLKSAMSDRQIIDSNQTTWYSRLAQLKTITIHSKFVSTPSNPRFGIDKRSQYTM